MWDHFVDKIHFYKVLSMSDKPRLHQLKITTLTSSTVKASLTVWILSRKGEYPVLRTNTKPCQLIKHAKISYSITPLLFCKFLYWTYQNGLHQVPQNWGTPSTSKSTNGVSSIPFVQNMDFSILLHRVRCLKNLFMITEDNRSSFSQVSLKSETEDMHP